MFLLLIFLVNFTGILFYFYSNFKINKTSNVCMMEHWGACK